MKGSKRERRPGVWELRVGAGRDTIVLDGSVRYRTRTRTVKAGTEAQAERLLRAFTREVEQERTAGTRQTVEWLVRRYTDPDISPAAAKWEPRTLDNYRSLAEANLIPALGHVALSRLTVDDIEDFYGRLRRAGAKPSTIRSYGALLGGALRYAVKRGYITTNPAALAELPGVPERRIDAPDIDVFQQVIAAARETNPTLAAYMTVACTTGARRGELVALRWSSVDLTDGTLLIDQAAKAVKGRGVVIGDTKTHQSRRIAVDRGTLEVIAAHTAWQADTARTAGVTLVEDPYLFASRVDGSRPIHPDSAGKAFHKLRDQLGLPYVQLKETRHLVASTLLASGVDLRTAASRLGHGGGGITTLRVYARPMRETDRAAAEHMGQLMAPRAGLEPARPARESNPATPRLEVSAGRPARGAPEE